MEVFHPTCPRTPEIRQRLSRMIRKMKDLGEVESRIRSDAKELMLEEIVALVPDQFTQESVFVDLTNFVETRLAEIR